MEKELSAAIEVIKSNLSSFGHHPFRAVNRTAATAALCRALQIDDSEAQQLCRSAIEQYLGGYIKPIVLSGGLRGGRSPRRTVQETWWIDTTVLL